MRELTAIKFLSVPHFRIDRSNMCAYCSVIVFNWADNVRHEEEQCNAIDNVKYCIRFVLNWHIKWTHLNAREFTNHASDWVIHSLRWLPRLLNAYLAFLFRHSFIFLFLLSLNISTCERNFGPFLLTTITNVYKIWLSRCHPTFFFHDLRHFEPNFKVFPLKCIIKLVHENLQRKWNYLIKKTRRCSLLRSVIAHHSSQLLALCAASVSIFSL